MTKWAEHNSPMVLVVDGEEAIREMIRVRLDAHGYEVAGAADGAEGARLALRDVPEAAIISCTLPVMSGLDMLETVRNQHHGRRIPVIMLLRDEQPVDVARAKALGVDSFITLPFDVNDVLKEVQGVTEQSGEKARGGGIQTMLKGLIPWGHAGRPPSGL
jgi:DNA-binding response OmpR family regulator